jgi:uncharacterized protein (TIGR02172 family)
MKVQKISEGNTAEVFTWGEYDILKLLRKEFPMVAIEQEYHAGKAVEELGLPVPKAKDMLEYEGRTGIVYEKIQGNSLLKLLTVRPWTVGSLAKIIAKMHYDMHQQNGGGLPDCVEMLRWRINHAEGLSEHQKEEILKTLESLPKGSSVCHGDYHPGNIIKSGNRCVILDWMTATAGQPAYDVARTIYLLKDAAIPGYYPSPVMLVMNRTRKYLAHRYLSCYIKFSGMRMSEIDAWRLPLISARLSEWVPESEKEALLTEIKEITGVQ